MSFLSSTGMAWISDVGKCCSGSISVAVRLTSLKENEASFVGDDIVDLQIMSRCGLAIAVSDAHTFVKKHAHWVTAARGGHGAVREVCELLLDAQGLLKKALSYNLR